MKLISLNAFVKKGAISLLAVCLVITLLAWVQTGEDYELIWSTIDGGGGWSSGPDYVLVGIIGQPDAGEMSGGDYELVGGFLPGPANNPPLANAGPDQPAVECACNTTSGTQVTLDGTGSYDDDGDPLSYTWTGPFAESPASGPTPTVTLQDGCPGDYVITLIVNDGTEDSEPDYVTVTVEDNTPPVITCPLDVVLECPADTSVEANGYATAIDNCDDSPGITYSGSVSGSCPMIISRTWTATDESDNASFCVQTITVQDTTGPVITGVPVDVTAECDSVPAPANPTATDNCDSDVPIIFTETRTDGDCPDSYTLTRTWTATDNCGNTTTETQIITVQDTTPPEIVCPANVVLECPADTSVGANGSATATDNCDDSPVITYEDEVIPGVGNNETIIRGWTATDACGNSNSCEQIIVVEDTIAPELSVSVEPAVLWPPNHKMVEISSLISVSDGCDDSVDIVLTSITMNEGEETNAYDPNYDNTQGDGHTLDDIQVDAEGNIYLRAERSGKGNGRVYIITYEAIDASGNTSEATATVTVPHSQP